MIPGRSGSAHPSTGLDLEDHERDVHHSARRELAIWAEPVIADRIIESYRKACSDPERAAALTSQHRRMWQSIMANHQAIGSAARKELERLSKVGPLPVGLIHDVDRDIVDELMDIIATRYRASRVSAGRFGKIVAATAAGVDALHTVA